MSALLLDTHAWAWSFYRSERLSDRARQFMSTADMVLVSPVSLYEIGQKTCAGKWPEMAPHLDRLPETLAVQGISPAPLTPEIALHAAQRDWPHRDPFDRILASTAELMDIDFVTRDAAFGDLPALRCIW